MRKKIFGLIICSILPVSLMAQFKFERKNDSFAFEPAKKISFYSKTRFNRVEGLSLHAGLKFQPLKNDLIFKSELWYGASITAKEALRYQFSVEKDINIPSRLAVGVRFFDKIASADDWVNTDYENSLAGLFAHRDYRDWFGKKGFLGYLDLRIGETHTLRTEVSRIDYEILNILPNADWSLFSFAHDRKFAPNSMRHPFLNFAEGAETTFRLLGVFDKRDNPVFPTSGWLFEGIFEKTSGDFKTKGLFATLKYFRPLFGNQRLQAKIMLGSRTDATAAQHLMGLGGPGSLRGFEPKEFFGDRLLHGAVNYYFGGAVLQNLPLGFIPFWDTFSLGLFTDMGNAWFAGGPAYPSQLPANGNSYGLLDFSKFSTDAVHVSPGISLLIAEGLIRVDFAKQTDGRGGWQIYFHLLDKF